MWIPVRSKGIRPIKAQARNSFLSLLTPVVRLPSRFLTIDCSVIASEISCNGRDAMALFSRIYIRGQDLDLRRVCFSILGVSAGALSYDRFHPPSPPRSHVCEECTVRLVLDLVAFTPREPANCFRHRTLWVTGTGASYTRNLGFDRPTRCVEAHELCDRQA